LQQSNVTNSPHVRTVTPGETTAYTVTARNAYDCAVTSNAATVTVIPPAPGMLSAVATGTDRVLVSWTFTGSADQFEIERFDRIPGSPAGYRVIGTAGSSATSYLDVGLPANTAVLYRIRAVKAGTSSAASGIDLATTTMFTDATITALVTRARAAHITELRAAVNAVRLLAGLGASSFTDPGLSLDWAIRTVHITEMRTALNAARSALSLPAISYADPSLASMDRLRTVHVTDLRGGVQ